jgi:hypothetical protein
MKVFTNYYLGKIIVASIGILTIVAIWAAIIYLFRCIFN